MLIQALNKYYDARVSDGIFPEDGTSYVEIDYLIVLTPDGKIDDILNHQENKRPQIIVLPKRTEKTCADANYIEHRCSYIFGLTYNKSSNKFTVAKGEGKKKYDDFVRKNLKFIDGVHTPLVDAYRNFIEKWNPEEETENKLLTEATDLKAKWSERRFAFCLVSDSNDIEILNYDHSIELQEKWKAIRKEYIKGLQKNQCAITGKIKPIAPLHDKLKGIAGGLGTGTAIVSCDKEAFSSFENNQGDNSSISFEEMEKYTRVLNYFLKNQSNKKIIGDMTLLFWAIDGDTSKSELFKKSIFPDFKVKTDNDADETLTLLNHLFDQSTQLKITKEILENANINPNVEFYILGLKPNGGRNAIKMFYRNNFGKIINNIVRFQQNIHVDDAFEFITIYDIQKALLPSKASDNKPTKKNNSQDKFNSALTAKLLKSIIFGSDIPVDLYINMLNRMKIDKEPTRKVKAIRLGIVKEFINQKNRKNKEEEIKMALDTKNNNQAYLCGRLFAAIQKTQEDSLAGKKLNRTIKDSFYYGAATRPATVFPRLMLLYPVYLKKIKDNKENPNAMGMAINREKLIQEIFGKINSFPKNLSMNDQGNFHIGYYAQYQNFFEKKQNPTIND